MSRTVVIEPVTRIEGHAKISLFLDDRGEVSDARFAVAEFRGFERFCVGRPLAEMPSLTARICGICPVSHLLASAKAGDAILAVDIPPSAVKLRRLMNLGQLVQSHALSFFHLSAPDLLLGWDSDPAARNVFGLMNAYPEIARQGIRLRQFGQDVIAALGGAKIHPAWAVPGGVRERPDAAACDALRARADEMRLIALEGIALLNGYIATHPDEVRTFGDFPSLYMALSGPDGAWEHYDGALRVIDAAGRVLANAHDLQQYDALIGEAVLPWSYLKSPYFKPLGYPTGMYRVGPLARLNICARIDTPCADRELRAWRERYADANGIVSGTFHYHTARLIEILAAIEHIERLLSDDDLRSTQLRAHAGINRFRGVGVSEAPRGTLFHHYDVDKDGLISAVNLVIATGQNNAAINAAVLHTARHYVHGFAHEDIPEGLLNRVEASVRAYDPCLSCSTHAIGQMPLQIDIFDASGAQVRSLTRGVQSS